MKSITEILNKKDHSHTIGEVFGGQSTVIQLLSKHDCIKAMQEYADEVLQELSEKYNSPEHGDYLKSAVVRLRNDLDFTNETTRTIGRFDPYGHQFDDLVKKIPKNATNIKITKLEDLKEDDLKPKSFIWLIWLVLGFVAFLCGQEMYGVGCFIIANIYVATKYN